jgi:hypothetical protein
MNYPLSKIVKTPEYLHETVNYTENQIYFVNRIHFIGNKQERIITLPTNFHLVQMN